MTNKSIRELRRDAPEEPDNTCPYIDPVIEALAESVALMETVVLQRGATPQIQSVIDKLDPLDDQMEGLRLMNSELRDGLYFWREACEKQCEEVEAQEVTISELEDEVSSLKAKLADAEEELTQTRSAA